MLQQWVLWHVLPRARRRVETAQPSDSLLGRARSSVITMCIFAAWLRQCDSSLAAVTQAPLAEWAADHLDSVAELGSFLRWVARRGRSGSTGAVGPVTCTQGEPAASRCRTLGRRP